MQFQSQNNYPLPSPGTQNLTPEGLRALEGVAQRNGFSLDAVCSLLDAVNRGNGNQAQFNHWEFGGMGQWSQGGMIMIGDMFNNSLKYRVSNLCQELSNLLRNQPLYVPPVPIQPGENVSLYVVGGSSGNQGWPSEYGYASTSGAQNNLRYAYFPHVRRLCIQQDGRVRTFETGDHQISGVSQQQGSDQSLTFTSQFGLVRLIDLPEIFPGDSTAQAPAPVAPQQPVYTQPAAPVYTETPAPFVPQQNSQGTDDIFQRIERLAELHQKGILSNEEFSAKKTELLSRL